MSKSYIFHIDINSFFATCAIIKYPFLKHKPFIVGGYKNSNKGVVSTASYEARKYGIKAGMSVLEAQKIYPKIINVETDYEMYMKYSKMFFDYLFTYTNKIIIGSIDEAYVDLTHYINNKNIDILILAKKIQDDLKKLYSIPVSIGISNTKFLAKMASDMKKPLGITILFSSNIPKSFYNLEIDKVFGIGKKSASLLKEKNILKINEFLDKSNKSIILSLFSENRYQQIINDLHGDYNDSILEYKEGIPKSIGHETTFNYNISDKDRLIEIIKKLFINIKLEFLKNNYLYKTINIKYKFDNFGIKTKSFSFKEYQDDILLAEDELINLFLESYQNYNLRLIGISISNIILNNKKKMERNLFNQE